MYNNAVQFTIQAEFVVIWTISGVTRITALKIFLARPSSPGQYEWLIDDLVVVDGEIDLEEITDLRAGK